MLEPAHRNVEPLVYEADTYRGQEEDEQEVQKIVNYKEINKDMWYKVKQKDYKQTIQEPEENLRNAKKKVKMY